MIPIHKLGKELKELDLWRASVLSRLEKEPELSHTNTLLQLTSVHMIHWLSGVNKQKNEKYSHCQAHTKNVQQHFILNTYQSGIWIRRRPLLHYQNV